MEAVGGAGPCVAGPSTLWRFSERRSRKVGSPNIFYGVNLRQLQRLFRAGGDQDAEQRAKVVWGHGDEAGLAQALLNLRNRNKGLRRRPEASRDSLEPRWLRAFGHLRISEGAAHRQRDEEENVNYGKDSDDEAVSRRPTEHQTDPGAMATHQDQGGSKAGPVCSLPGKLALVLRRGGESDPDRYLHRVKH